MVVSFKLSDKPTVRPEDFNEGTVLINCSLPKPIHKVATQAAADAGVAMTVWTAGAVLRYMHDLDAVLMAMMDARTMHKAELTKSHSQKFRRSDAKVLKDASSYLIGRGYPKVALGQYVEACIILRLDAEGLIPKVV